MCASLIVLPSAVLLHDIHFTLNGPAIFFLRELVSFGFDTDTFIEKQKRKKENK